MRQHLMLRSSGGIFPPLCLLPRVMMMVVLRAGLCPTAGRGVVMMVMVVTADHARLSIVVMVLALFGCRRARIMTGGASIDITCRCHRIAGAGTRSVLR